MAAILYNLLKKAQQFERRLENSFIKMVRRAERMVFKSSGAASTGYSKELAAYIDCLEEPARTYYLRTHTKPYEFRVDSRFKRRIDQKINLGAGSVFKKSAPDWVTVDIGEHEDYTGMDVVMDFTVDPLPFPDESVSLAFTSHTIEHPVGAKT